jgi:antitoxin component of MazEF toxin-antitoxin module
MFGSKRKLDNIYFGMNKKNKKTIDNNVEDIDIENIFKNILMTSLEKKKEDIKVQRENNHIYFHCEVDRESIFELTTLIREAEEESLFTSFKFKEPPVKAPNKLSAVGECFKAVGDGIRPVNWGKAPSILGVFKVFNNS